MSKLKSLETKLKQIGKDHSYYERGLKLYTILKPIKWDLSSSVASRKNLVNERRKVVYDALPFLLGDEITMAIEWLKKEQHSGLWD